MHVAVFSNVRRYSDIVGQLLAARWGAEYHEDIPTEPVDEDVSHVYNAPWVKLKPKGELNTFYIHVNLATYYKENDEDMQRSFFNDMAYRHSKEYTNAELLKTVECVVSVFDESPEDIAQLIYSQIMNCTDHHALLINPAHLEFIGNYTFVDSYLVNTLEERYADSRCTKMIVPSFAIFTLFGTTVVSDYEHILAASKAGIKLVKLLKFQSTVLTGLPTYHLANPSNPTNCDWQAARAVMRSITPDVWQFSTSGVSIENTYWDRLADFVK